MNRIAKTPLARRLVGPLAVVLAAAAALAPPPPASACTTLRFGPAGSLASTVRVAKSYDWHSEEGLVFANPRGLHKRALHLDARETAAEWTSTYGSLTFNQYGQEFPNGGINEAGLVVEVMWLQGSDYPARDGRPALNELQWVQHALDRFATVEALAEAAPRLRVAPAYARIHYLACDPSGACATFEYLDGELAIHRGDELPVAALTNHPYAE